MNYAQNILAVCLGLSFFAQLMWAVNGRPARKPTGEGGIALVLVVFAINCWLYYKAGLFHAQ